MHGHPYEPRDRSQNRNTDKMYYSDNGDDFNKTIRQGLGLEITQGLIVQMDGTVEAKRDNGFEVIIYFK